MSSKTAKIAGIILSGVMLAGSVGQAFAATGEQATYQECISKAKQAQNPSDARNQCIWNHWENTQS